jgi:hypothetical protein
MPADRSPLIRYPCPVQVVLEFAGLMNRREFLTLLGGTAAGWSITARAQQPTGSVIMFLGSRRLQARVATYVCVIDVNTR